MLCLFWVKSAFHDRTWSSRTSVPVPLCWTGGWIISSQMYATVFCSEAIVFKSGALKQFASHCRAWNAQPGHNIPNLISTRPALRDLHSVEVTE
jgi:hypothetical protein